MRNFIGRDTYLKKLESLWAQKRSQIVALYGRRRVGKSELIHFFSQNKKCFYFEALEDQETPVQIKHFLAQLSEVLKEPYIKDLAYEDWPPVLDLLTQKIKEEKNLVLVFDELPWMAVGRSKLVSYLKFYWDQKWKRQPHLFLILCGSVTSWMIKNVVRSSALYGRLGESILLDPLLPFEVSEFIGKKRGQKEALEYLLCFGGIPRYLEEFDFNRSLQINIEKTCFNPSGFFFSEAQKIFYSQFRETGIYKQIVKSLLAGPLSLHEISQKLKIPSGGGLKQYLENLRYAQIIDRIPLIQNFKSGKTFRYYFVDEFLRFHAHFIAPHADAITHAASGLKFEVVTEGAWYAFLGLAFERFCLKHRYTIANILEFRTKIIACGPVLENKKGGYQYDLVFLRKDGVITLCEVKYLTTAPSTKLIAEMEEKIIHSHFPRNLTVEKILITNQEPSKGLEESRYFHVILPTSKIVEYASA